jgi:hypothetical protein
MSYSQQQFQQHLGQLRGYSYLQGQKQRIQWLWDKYAEKQFTESSEREFVSDFDVHLEELANTLSNDDFKKMYSYWIPLAKKFWGEDRRNDFVKRVDRLSSSYRSNEAERDIISVSVKQGRKGRYTGYYCIAQHKRVKVRDCKAANICDECLPRSMNPESVECSTTNCLYHIVEASAAVTKRRLAGKPDSTLGTIVEAHYGGAVSYTTDGLSYTS